MNARDMLYMESGIRLKEKKYTPSEEELEVPHPEAENIERMEKKDAEHRADYMDALDGTSEWLANQGRK